MAIKKNLIESNEELRDVLNKLEDYPLVDEEVHSEMEAEGIESAWKDWGANDFLTTIRAGHESLAEFEPEGLTQKLGLVDLRHHLVTTGDSDLPDDKLRFFFEDCREEANEYWEDDGGSMFIRMEKVAPFAVDRLLVMLMPRLQLPLLLGREWKSKEVFNEFERLLKGD